MSLTFAQQHSLPKHSVLREEVLRETFFGLRSTIYRMRKESKLGIKRISGEDVQLVDGERWDLAIRKEKNRRDVVGYYFRDERRCYVRYGSACQSKREKMRMKAQADCASTIGHEMIHYASDDGLLFSTALNEAVTEWLNEDRAITATITENVGLPPPAYSYETEREMWSIMRANEPQTVPDLVRCYWTGNSTKAMRIIRRNFGDQILAALSKEKPSPKSVIRLMRG